MGTAIRIPFLNITSIFIQPILPMKLYLKTKDHVVSGETFDLLHDEALDMLVTTPQPEDLTKYYETGSYISHTDANKTLVDKVYQAIKRYSLIRKLSLIGNYAKGQRTLLDFGAGTGDFLGLAKQKGWQVEGVEPNGGARKRAAEKGLDLLDEIPTGYTKKFQVIALWHVLEHLPDLENQLTILSELLEEGGTLVIAVPNFKSYDAQHYGSFWAAYDAPRHLWHFSQHAIQGIFSPIGLKVMAIKPMIFDAFYVSLLSEKYKYGKTNYIRAFFNGLLSNLKAWRSKQYSSHIYILQRN